jgi:membrane protein implicated in regulation of membrane protease activity
MLIPVFTLALFAATAPATPASWSDVLQAVLVAVLPIVAAYLIKAGLDAWVKFQGQKSDAAYTIQRAATVAVTAAEQLGATKAITDKKSWAVNFAQNWLDAHGVHVDVALIEGAIESAVYTEFNEDEPVAPAAPAVITATTTTTPPAPAVSVYVAPVVPPTPIDPAASVPPAPTEQPHP